MAEESPYEWQRVRTLFWGRPPEAAKNGSANRCHTTDLQRTAGTATKIKNKHQSGHHTLLTDL